MIERKKIELDTEKNIIIGMLFNNDFLRDIRGVLTDFSLLKSDYYKIIGKWCVDFYSSYEKAPNELIDSIFEHNKESLKEDISENIAKTITELKSKNPNNFNKDYFFDIARKYLKSRSLEKLSNDLKIDIMNNDIETAENRIVNYKRVEKITGAGIDLISETQKVLDAFLEDKDTLIKFKGAFGEGIKSIYRGDVIGIGAPQKRGKTWFLGWFGTTAMLQGLKVAHWNIEMQDTLMLKRIFPALLGETRYKNQEITMPFFTEENDIDFKIIKKKGIEIENIFKYQNKLKKIVRGGGYRLFDSSTGGDTVESIEYTLNSLEYFDDYLVDVLIIDYADILQPGKNSPKDYRNQINSIWLALKKLAQKRNILIVTASQMGREMLKKDGDESDIAEDIRKFAHVSHWINLNQNKKEKDKGIMRVRISGRHDEFRNDDVVCLSCLAIGRPVVDSRWKKDIPNYLGQINDSTSENEEEEKELKKGYKFVAEKKEKF